ncbi:MAG: hypothetical protein AAGC68_07945, partial [Verrucomicrobiota bacterium]
LRPAIEARLPDSVSVIDTGPAVARRVESLLEPLSDLSKESTEILIETTGDLAVLERLFPKLMPGLEATLIQSPLMTRDP